MRAAFAASSPVVRTAGEWHLPFVGTDDGALSIEERKQVSVARCARVSYLTHVGTRDVAADKVLHQRLLDAGHWSPFEHVAVAAAAAERFNNFSGWQAYRHQMEQARTLVMSEVAPA